MALSEFALFAIIMVPTGILAGIAMATVSFTAWMLVVPLLLVVFKFALFDALALAMAIDFLNGFVLMAMYWRFICWRDVLYGAVFSCSVAIGVSFLFGEEFLKTHEGLLKGGVGYIDFALSLLFLGKFGMYVYRQRKAKSGHHVLKEALLSNEDDDTMLQDSAAEAGQIQGATSNTNTDDGKKGGGMHTVVPLDELYAVRTAWSTKEKWARYGGVAAAFAFGGALAGAVGVGGGMLFVIILVLGFKVETIRGTATAALIMSCVMAVMIARYATLIQWGVIYTHLLVALGASLFGTAIAAKFTLLLSEHRLNLAIGIVLMTVGIAVTVESSVIHKK